MSDCVLLSFTHKVLAFIVIIDAINTKNSHHIIIITIINIITFVVVIIIIIIITKLYNYIINLTADAPSELIHSSFS